MQGGRRDSRVQEVSDISSGLKAIAKELDVPVLALSQLSRESEQRENKRPQLSDLRDSGSIEQDADVVLFLYREGMHNREIDRGKTELIVAKNRNGPVDDLPLVFIAEQTAFREPYLAASDAPARQPVARCRRSCHGPANAREEIRCNPGSMVPMRRSHPHRPRRDRIPVDPGQRDGRRARGPRPHDQHPPGCRRASLTPIRSGSPPRSG